MVLKGTADTFLKVRDKVSLPSSMHLFGIVPGSRLAGAGRREKQQQSVRVEKEEAKRAVFADDTIVYIENPKQRTGQLLGL